MKQAWAIVIGFLLAAALAAAQTHTVLTNDQNFTAANGRSITGTYECSGAGTISGCAITGGSGSFSGNATTATALASAPTKCSANQATIGIDTSGNAQGCFNPIALPGGSTTQIQYNNASAFGGSANLTFDFTNFRLRGQNLTTSNDGTLNMSQFSGTMPSVPTAAVEGFDWTLSGAGSASQSNWLAYFRYNAGYTGASSTYTAEFYNNNSGTASNLELNLPTRPEGNISVYGLSTMSSLGSSFGLIGDAASNSNSVGVYGRASSSSATGTNIGVLGNAVPANQGTAIKAIAGLFTLNSGYPSGGNISFALGADNGAIAGSIFRGYDGGVLVFNLADVVGTAVNGVSITGGATTVAPIIAAMGETDVDLAVNAKGTGFVTHNAPVVLGSYTVTGLPTCGTTRKGAIATVTDANAACVFVAAPAGGGTTVCPVYCDGTNWLEG